MSVTKRTGPRCVATCADGTQCGRRVTDGSNPAICHIHRGQTNSPLIPPPDEIDPPKILTRLAKDSDPRVRLRAVNLILELKAKEKAANKRDDDYDGFFEAMTPEELAEFDAIMATMEAFKEKIYSTRPHLRPVEKRQAIDWERSPDVEPDDI